MKTHYSDINSHDGGGGGNYALPPADPSIMDDPDEILEVTFHLFSNDNPTTPMKEVSVVEYVEAGGQKLADNGPFQVLFPTVLEIGESSMLTPVVTGSICCSVVKDPHDLATFVHLANEEGAAAVIVSDKPPGVQSDIPILEVESDTLSMCRDAKSVKATVGVVGPTSYPGAVADKPKGNSGTVSQKGTTANDKKVNNGDKDMTSLAMNQQQQQSCAGKRKLEPQRRNLKRRGGQNLDKEYPDQKGRRKCTNQATVGACWPWVVCRRIVQEHQVGHVIPFEEGNSQKRS